MTLSIGQMGDGFAKSMRQARTALEARLTSRDSTHRTGQSWSFHWGAPRADALPNEPMAVWLMPLGVEDDPEAPFRSNYFVVEWRLSVVVQDPGTDDHGYDTSRSDDAAGAVLKALTEDLDARSLDGSVDFTDQLRGSFAIAEVSGGDAQVGEWMFKFKARHPLLYRD